MCRISRKLRCFSRSRELDAITGCVTVHPGFSAVCLNRGSLWSDTIGGRKYPRVWSDERWAVLCVLKHFYCLTSRQTLQVSAVTPIYWPVLIHNYGIRKDSILDNELQIIIQICQKEWRLFPFVNQVQEAVKPNPLKVATRFCKLEQHVLLSLFDQINLQVLLFVKE